MATFTQTIRHGEDTFEFTFDDAQLRLTGLHFEVVGRHGYVLEILGSDGSVERSFSIPMGTFDRSLPGNERKAYTLTDSISRDGIRAAKTVNLPHRIRGT